MSENKLKDKLKDMVTRMSDHAATLFDHECVTQGVEIERSDVLEPVCYASRTEEGLVSYFVSPLPAEETVCYAHRRVFPIWDRDWDKVTEEELEEGLVSNFVSPLVRELVTELKSKSNKYVLTNVTQDETPLTSHVSTRNVTVTLSFDPSIPVWIVVVSVITKSK